MSRRKKRSLPKYAPAVIRAAERAQAEGAMKPGLYVVDVHHDSWCNLLKGIGPCNCNPDVLPPKPVIAPEDN